MVDWRDARAGGGKLRRLPRRYDCSDDTIREE